MNVKELVRQEMEKTSRVILSYPWHNAQAYGMWLAQTYCMVNHSTRLVALAGAYSPIGQESLHHRFVDHSREERGHEKICVSDIKELGYELRDFPKLPPSEAMYQIQYYWIQHRGPTSFFGYTLALECLAEYFGPQIFKMCCDAHGPKAAKFLKLHSEADVEHVESAFEQIDKLPVQELELVRENLLLSSETYRWMLIEARQRSESVTIRKAA